MNIEVEGLVVAKKDEVVGAAGMRKVTLVVETQERYPQKLPVEFIKDSAGKADEYSEGDHVTISADLRGREWNDRYFVSINGWRIKGEDAMPAGVAAGSGGGAPDFSQDQPVSVAEKTDDLPF